jgi:hypothetical protein
MLYHYLNKTYFLHHDRSTKSFIYARFDVRCLFYFQYMFFSTLCLTKWTVCQQLIEEEGGEIHVTMHVCMCVCVCVCVFMYLCREKARETVNKNHLRFSLAFVLWHARNGYYTIVISTTHTHTHMHTYIHTYYYDWEMCTDEDSQLTNPSGEDELTRAYLQID